MKLAEARYIGIQNYQEDFLSPNENYFCNICGHWNCHKINRDGMSCEENIKFEYDDLGSMENWKESPKKYKDCTIIEEHKPEVYLETHNYIHYECSDCKIEWRIKK